MDVTFFSDSLCINKFEFYGRFSQSKDGKYIIAWSDPGPGGSIVKKSNYYNYILLYENKPIFKGILQRPNDGKVANNGNFILNDWLSVNELNGIFYVFDKTGKIMVLHKTNANLFSNAISINGNFALTATASSDNEDSNSLFFFDLTQKKLLWRIQPESGLSYEYKINTEEKKIVFLYRELGEFAYNFSGEFINFKNWLNKSIEVAGGESLLYITKRYYLTENKYIDKIDYDKALFLLTESLNRDFQYLPIKAKIHREIGEIYEKLGDLGKTIEHFEKALAIDPKVGVKLRLKELKKETYN